MNTSRSMHCNSFTFNSSDKFNESNKDKTYALIYKINKLYNINLDYFDMIVLSKYLDNNYR